MHYFAAPLHPGQQTTLSLRAGQYKRPTKRKRDEDDEDADDPEEPPISLPDDAASPAATLNSPAPSSFGLSLAASDASQRRVAGLLPEDTIEIPPFPFPHA